MRGARNDDDEDDDGDECFDEDSDDGYIPCPHCGETMLEAADYCPSCSQWITSEDVTARLNSWWIIGVVVVLIGAIMISILPI